MAGNSEIVKGVFQLEVDLSKLDAGLNDAAGKFSKVTVEATKQQKKIQQLVIDESKLIEARNRANNPTSIIKYENKLKEVRKQMQSLTKETTEMAKSTRVADQQSSALSRSMKSAYNKTQIAAATNQIKDGTKELKAMEQTAGGTGRKIEETGNAFKKLQADLKAAKGSLAEALQTGDQEKISAAQQKVGKLKKEFNDLNDEVNLFSKGSKFEQVGSLLGDIGSKILKLDFKEANEKSEKLLKLSKTITFKETLGGVKDLTKTFANLATALLSNPLFILAAVVVGIAKAYEFWNDNLSENALRVARATKELEHQRFVNSVLIAQIERNIVLTDAQRGSEEALLGLKRKKAALEQEELKKSIALNNAKIQQIQSNDTFIEGYYRVFATIEKAIGLESLAAKTSKKFDAEKRERQKEFIKQNVEDANKFADSQNNTLAEETKLGLKRQDQVRELVENLKKEQDKLKDFDINFRLSPDSEKQIKEKFQLQRDELKRTQDEEKRLALIEFAGFRDRKKALGLINKKFSAQNKLLAEQEIKEIIGKEKELRLNALDARRKAEEQLLDIGAATILTEKDVAEEKILILNNFYKDKNALLEENIKREEEAGLDTTESVKKLALFKKDAALEEAQAIDNLAKINKTKKLTELDEEQRHSNEMLKLKRSIRLKFSEIEEDRNVEDLEQQVKFENEKFNTLLKTGKATKEEVDKQYNAIIEKEAELEQATKKARQQRLLAIIDGSKQVFDTIASAANQSIQTQIDNIDRLTSAQEQRVEDAKKIAEEGNTAILEAEQERLDQMNRQKEAAVRRQQTIAQVEIAINSAVAITKAAVEGGAAAPFTIAATIIALIAGIAKARTIASQAAFYEGGMWEGQGYTGDGNPHDPSTAVGGKPYMYHKREFIFNHVKTNQYRNIFEDIHKGKIDLNDWKDKVAAFEIMQNAQHAGLAQTIMMAPSGEGVGELKGQLEQLTRVVENQTMYFNMDEQGFNARLRNIKSRNDYIRHIAKP
jgi:hypothetical protein